MITDNHAKLFAHKLSRRHSIADAEKIAGTLFDAPVDLHPHQVEAALFAFKSALSKGAILADEVGLGKTIEAGLVLSQKWTESRRHILVIGSANRRKQWEQDKPAAQVIREFMRQYVASHDAEQPRIAGDTETSPRHRGLGKKNVQKSP